MQLIPLHINFDAETRMIQVGVLLEGEKHEIALSTQTEDPGPILQAWVRELPGYEDNPLKQLALLHAILDGLRFVQEKLNLS